MKSHVRRPTRRRIDSAQAVADSFDPYIEKVVDSSGARNSDREGLAVELHDHLLSLKAELASVGMGPDEATAKAIDMLGSADRVGRAIRQADKKRDTLRTMLRSGLALLVVAVIACLLLIPGLGPVHIRALGGSAGQTIVAVAGAKSGATRVVASPIALSTTSPSHATISPGLFAANLMPLKTVRGAVADATRPLGSLDGLVQLLAKALLYALAGLAGCWAFGSHRQRRFLLGLLLAASAVEVLQYSLGTGVADIDDVLICLFGGWLGWKAGASALRYVRQTRDRAVLRSIGQ